MGLCRRCAGSLDAALPCDAGRFNALPGSHDASIACLVRLPPAACRPPLQPPAPIVSRRLVNAQPCPNGTIAPSHGSTRCELCPAGHSCLQAAALPTPCLPGSFSGLGVMACEVPQACCPPACCPPACRPDGNMGLLQPCPPGSFCPVPAMALPLPCTNGSYSTAPGQLSCLPCPAGHACLTTFQDPVSLSR